MIPPRRYPLLLASVAALLLGLAAAPGCCKRWCATGQSSAQADNATEAGSAGVTVTSPVPHAVITGAATDDAAPAPSPPSVPREIPIGKLPPPKVIPSTEEPK